MLHTLKGLAGAIGACSLWGFTVNLESILGNLDNLIQDYEFKQALGKLPEIDKNLELSQGK